MSEKKIIISGGGTGGHIFPAISIANALKEIEPETQILFVGALGRMEMEKVPAAGYNIIGLPISGIQRSLSVKNITLIFKLLKSMWLSRKIIRDFKPDVVVGVGGYASGPMLKSAAQKGVPTLIQEQNSYAGVTNRLLAKKAKKICVAYENMDNYFPAEKILLTGNPVRKTLLNLNINKETAAQKFNLDLNKKTILSVGGSLGAGTLNKSIAKNIDLIAKSNIQLIWQTGKGFFEEAKQIVANAGAVNVKVFDFISEMDKAFTVADLVISRAGAGTISELCIVAKPVIFVPSPNVAEDHQTKNANALVRKNAAIMVKDQDAENILINQALNLIKDENKLTELSGNIAKLALPNSSEVIAREVLKLVEK